MKESNSRSVSQLAVLPCESMCVCNSIGKTCRSRGQETARVPQTSDIANLFLTLYFVHLVGLVYPLVSCKLVGMKAYVAVDMNVYVASSRWLDPLDKVITTS